MSDLKTALSSVVEQQRSPSRMLPQNSYPPAPPHRYPQKGNASAQKPPPAVSRPPSAPKSDDNTELPKQKPPAALGPAELIVHKAIRDSAKVELTFIDGSTLTAAPVAIGQYVFLLCDDVGEVAVFKHAIRTVRRAK